MSKITSAWYKTHRPTTIDDYIFQNDFYKEKFLEYINDHHDIPDLLLSGHRGTGKTTLGLILRDALDVSDIDFLKLNASDDNSVNTVRGVIKSFMSTASFGKFKIIFLDEADAMTTQAQEALKSMMEEESRNIRFILTSNNPQKLIPELRSRCTEYTFDSMDKMSMKGMGTKILMEHGMDASSVDVDELNAMLDAHLKVTYPDLRKFITSLEQHFIKDVLHPPMLDSEHMESLVALLLCIEQNNWQKARNVIYERIPPDSITGVYSFLDQNLIEVSEDVDLLCRGYTTLALYAYRDDTMAVPELNLTACIIKLCEIFGEKK
jgi:replication-associated recombination protein RarA